jgi:23S rRNA (guanine2445-N2)-methyltransferase / 23S rRNA (guanine2069-N7)-methyltransferase
LNLFCYTASATVAAALGGASASLSVDLSPTYLDWADRNLELNGIDPRRHQLEQADALSWLRRAQVEFDLIYVDPPSFSNSKRTDTVLDIQRDQIELLHLAMARLAAAGKLLFVTNLRRFKLAPELSEAYAVREVSAASIPPDFERNQRIHQAWWLRHKD